jgi:hypothetical protein
MAFFFDNWPGKGQKGKSLWQRFGDIGKIFSPLPKGFFVVTSAAT